MKKNYKIAVIPGDGIGKEVIPEGIRILNLLEPILISLLHGRSMTGVVSQQSVFTRKEVYNTIQDYSK